MHTEWSTNNIFQKIKSKILNHPYCILYYANDTTFDLILPKCTNDNYVIVQAQDKQHIHSINYNYTAISSLFITHSELDSIFSTNTDLIIFNHSNLSSTKKEDLSILAKNTKNAYIINFDRSSDSILPNTININYPIPKYNMSSTKEKDVLIFNLNNDNMINNIAKAIKKQNINIDIITSINGDIDSLYHTLSNYKVILDLSSRINILCSLMCGCNIVTNIDLNNHLEKKYVYQFTKFEDIFMTIKKALQEPRPDISDLIETYDSNNLNNTLAELSK